MNPLFREEEFQNLPQPVFNNTAQPRDTVDYSKPSEGQISLGKEFTVQFSNFVDLYESALLTFALEGGNLSKFNNKTFQEISQLLGISVEEVISLHQAYIGISSES